MDRIDEIRARCEEATPGEWRTPPTFNGICSQSGDILAIDRIVNPRAADMIFIAHAREDIPFLLDKLAAYEDTGLMPDEINAIVKSQIATAKHNVELQEEAARFKADLQRYKQLEADGRLVELPCLVNGRSVLTRHPRTGRLITVRCDTRTEAETMIAKCPACRAEKEVAE